jgi:hypothetical protein
MKKIILLMTLLPIANLIFAQQNIYYKAVYLLNKRNPVTGTITLDNDVKDVLQEFYPKQAVTIKLLNTNPFFFNRFEEGGGSGAASFTSKSLSKLGGLDVTNLADGFARFIVKRTKEELSASFFEKFSELISQPEYKDAQTLFPQTYSTLKTLGNKIYNYKAYLNVLRESFEADLNSLLPNLSNLMNDERYQEFFKSHKELKAICLSSIYVGNGLINKQHPGQILANYPTDAFLGDSTLVNANGAIKTLQLFSESIRSRGTSTYWVSVDSVSTLVENEAGRELYLGLIYEKAEKIKFKTTTLQAVLKKLQTDSLTATLVPYLQGLHQHTSRVTTSIMNIAGKDQSKLLFTDYYAFYSASLDLLEHSATTYTIPGLEGLKPDANTKNRIQTARSVGVMALDISRRNYSSAIINLYQFYSQVITDAGAEKSKEFILTYGSFMAAVAQAENSEEVENAIEAAALPSGSSRIKRETIFNVSLNAYAGLFAGNEKIKGVKTTGSKFNSFGVAAPIGIAISRGHSFFFLGTGSTGWKTNKRSWSTSLFLSVVDLGALTAFRFSNDSTESVPKIQLKDIISPGVFISIGIPKSPLSVNMGYQIGPLLREVSQKQNTYSQHYSRISISLCVDIPLLNFYTKSKD